MRLRMHSSLGPFPTGRLRVGLLPALGVGGAFLLFAPFSAFSQSSFDSEEARPALVDAEESPSLRPHAALDDRTRADGDDRTDDDTTEGTDDRTAADDDDRTAAGGTDSTTEGTEDLNALRRADGDAPSWGDLDDFEYVLDEVIFIDPPSTFSRFNLESARSREDLDMQEARTRAVRTLDEAVAELTPFSPLASTGASPGALLVDGLDGSWVQVLVDGIPFTRTVTTRNGPIPDLGAVPVDPSRVERIEVYRGAGPAGTCGSSGLVLNLITKSPDKQFTGSISADTGVSRHGVSRYSVRGDVTIPLADSWALRARGSFQKTPELDVTGSGSFDRPRRELDDAELTALWRPQGEDRLTINARTFGTRTRNVGNPRAELEDRTRSRGLALDTRYRTPDHQENQFTLRTSVQHLSHVFSKYVRRTGFDRVKADTDAWALRANLTWAREFGDHRVGVELCSTGDIVERSGDSGQTPTITEGQICVGLNDTWRVSDRLTLEATALAGYHTKLDARWNGGLAAVWRINDLHGLRVSLDAAQRVPTVEERYLAFDHSELGYMLQGNPDLRSEEAYSARVGWVFRSPSQRIGMELTAFTTFLRNRIDPVLIAPAAPPTTPAALYSYENGGRGLSAGIDAVLRANDLGGWFGFDLSYNFLPIARDPDTNAELSLRSHHNGRLALRGSWLDGRLTAYTSGSVRSRLLWGTDDGGAPPKRPTVQVDAGIGALPHDAIWLGVTLRNLTDDYDLTWGPMPGFEALFSMNIQLHELRRKR